MDNNIKIIIGVAAAATVGGVAYYLYRTQKTTTPPVTGAPTITVTIT